MGNVYLVCYAMASSEGELQEAVAATQVADAKISQLRTPSGRQTFQSLSVAPQDLEANVCDVRPADVQGGKNP